MNEPFPRCFDSKEQYVAWVACARASHPKPGHSYCEDCTPKYQKQMIEERRCKFPGTTFHFTKDDGVYGRRAIAALELVKAGLEHTIAINYQ